mgnify:CR=1 FL=1
MNTGFKKTKTYKELKKQNKTAKNKFEIESIYNYTKDKKSINPHLVNPIYIKGIDVLNG